jgi:hypothetical protein
MKPAQAASVAGADVAEAAARLVSVKHRAISSRLQGKYRKGLAHSSLPRQFRHRKRLRADNVHLSHL